MKLNKKLKLVLIILTIILLSIIGFVGIYTQSKNQVNNVLPEYLLGMELQGYRKLELKMASEETELTTQENIVEENTTQEGTTQEQTNQENQTQENIKIAKNIINQRLNKMGVQEYYVRQDVNGQNIIIQIPENDNTDQIVAQLQSQGKFEIVDNETNEVLMTNSDIKSVEAGYGSTTYGTTIFLNIQFNKEGTEKFKNITNTYVEIEETEETETQTEETSEEATEETAEEKEKQIAIKVDDSTLLTTHFHEEISNGVLQLSVGSSTEGNEEELKESYEQAKSMAVLLDSGKMPIEYEINQNKYVQSDITKEDIVIGLAIGIIVLTILLIVSIIKNKERGILAAISIIGYIAILTIVLRYTNVIITIEGIGALIVAVIIEYAFLQSAASKNKSKFWNVYAKYFWILVPLMIISVVFALISNLQISSFGMVMFWAIVTKFIWNAIITKNILDNNK